MTLNDLDIFFDAAAALIPEIKSYHFGYLYEINQDRNRSYPLCLFIPPRPSYPDAYQPFESIPVVLYFYDLYQSAENVVKRKSKKWSELELIGMKFVESIRIALPISSPVVIEYGISEHNDQLAGVKLSFTVRMPSECDISLVEIALLDLPEHVFNEVPSGVIDGVNTVFTLAFTPRTGTTTVYQPGRQKLNVDYTVSGNTITFTNPPQVGDTLIVDYIKE